MQDADRWNGEEIEVRRLVENSSRAQVSESILHEIAHLIEKETQGPTSSNIRRTRLLPLTASQLLASVQIHG